MHNEPFPAFQKAENALRLAEAIVDTVREPLLVLDADLRVVVASRSFDLTFQLKRENTEGRRIYEVDGGMWNIPELQLLLEGIIPEHGTMDGFEVERDFPRIGHRSMLLNARKVFYDESGHTTILLSFEDDTQRRGAQRALEKLLAQKETLLAEMSHRVANSLQIIASILLLKSKSVDSEETRLHLQDAHRRVMSVASVQQQLHASGKDDEIDVGSYLTQLCGTLGASMIGGTRRIVLEVSASPATVNSTDAVSMGLIVTELVINALKYAFPSDAGRVAVAYKVEGSVWTLSIVDDGIGMSVAPAVTQKRVGLGTTLVKALAQQLGAHVEVKSGPDGTRVSIIHAVTAAELPAAA
jgi:two-component sensor histidine kinase